MPLPVFGARRALGEAIAALGAGRLDEAARGFRAYFASRIGLLSRTLRKSDAAPGREEVVRALESLGRVDLGLGTELELTPAQHQASHAVWPTVIQRGAVVPFRWESLHVEGGPHD